MASSKRTKIVLLGWDAADWKVINPLMDAGKMPNMKRLIEQGTISNLATLDPMYSPMLWSSIGTGKRPYKHRVLGFTEPTPDGQGVRPVMSVSRKARAIWNMMTLKNKRTHVVGWWPSHPAEHINGVMISNFFQNTVGGITSEWPISPGTVHPKAGEAFYAQFRVHPGELTGNHILPFVPNAHTINQAKDKRLQSIAKVTAHAASLHAAFTNILRTKEYDFAACYLDAIDHYCHGFMKYHPPRREHISQADFDMYHNVITAGYQYHDLMLGRVMDLIDVDTTLMLVSDHGFQPDHLRPRNIPKEPAGPAYEHNPLGVFAVMGPNIKKDHITFGASILDITPTLLAIAGMPVGDDMDGKPITTIFEDEPDIPSIPSWESVPGNSGMLSDDNVDVIANSGEEAIKQLEELGYIEKQHDDKEKRLTQTKQECNFNLARAYIDGGKIQEAIPLLEQLTKEAPGVARYMFRLAASYQAMGRLDDATKIIEEFKQQEQYSGPVLDVMLGSIALAQNKPLHAIKLFKHAEKHIDAHHARLYLQMARAYHRLRRFDEAEHLLLKEIDYNPDNDVVHFELGNVYLAKKELSAAISSFLAALGINFNNPGYHFQLGKALVFDGKYEEAVHALNNSLTINPHNAKARETLHDIYTSKIIDEKKAAEQIAYLKTETQGTIYIVSGLPRSGTSMMMQMLEKGGLEIFTDKKREKDDNNPKGYYEHEAVKTIAKNRRWLPQAEGKAMKVITQLVTHLPRNYDYKIVYMERDIHEILQSQKSMLKRLGSKRVKEDVYPMGIAKSYEQSVDKAKKWATTSRNVQILYINYRDIIQNPFGSAIQLNEFFGDSLNVESMVTAVDRSLYREKVQ